jgi:ABC-type sugar transport system ATPase subunit
MRGLGFPSPFIFDDPISSLDQDYEERVVARLVELAKDRQLIIFTHRLSLVTLLQEIMSNGDSHPPQIETLLRVGKHIGVPDTLKIRHQKPQQGFSEMQKSLGRLRVLEENGDILRLETSLNVACTDFRIQLEKAIETCLLNEIVLRFRRSLQTKDRLHKLRVIAVDDINFLENMMTKYSVYEHSQSDELPAQPIPLEELTRDIQAMIDWMANFKKKKPS